MGSVAKSYEEGLPNTVYKEIRKYFPIYEEAVSHNFINDCSVLNFLICI